MIEHDVIEAEFEPVEYDGDYSGWTKEELQEECRVREITFHPRHNEQSLIEKLENLGE